MAWLRERMRNHIDPADSIEMPDNVFRIPNAPAAQTIYDGGQAALDLIDQVADLIRGIEEHAAQRELRARHLAQDAVEKLHAAEAHIQSVEAERRAVEAGMNEANMRLQELEKTLKRTETRIAAAEAQLSAAELQASAAESRAIKAEKTLIRIEDAIRSQLLRQKREAANLAAAA